MLAEKVFPNPVIMLTRWAIVLNMFKRARTLEQARYVKCLFNCDAQFTVCLLGHNPL